MRRLLLFAFAFYSLGYVMRGVVRLYNPGSFVGDMVTDTLMFLGVFALAWYVFKRVFQTHPA